MKSGAREQVLFKGKYTLCYFDKCASIAKRRTETYLLTRMVMNIMSLGKSQDYEQTLSNKVNGTRPVDDWANVLN